MNQDPNGIELFRTRPSRLAIATNYRYCTEKQLIITIEYYISMHAN